LSQQVIKVGAAPGDGTGDPLRTAFTRVNANFTELYGSVAQTAAEIAASVTPINNTYAPGNVLRYGAVGDGSTECSPAFQSAINQALQNGGAPVLIPTSTAGFKVSNTLTVGGSRGYFTMIGQGPLSQINNNVTGNPANPLLLVNTKGPYFLFRDFTINGNQATGSNGNGHAIAFINPDSVGVAGITTFYPQAVLLQNVILQYHQGNGKDFQGASIPACAVYQYGITAHNIDGCYFFQNACGQRTYLSQKIHFSECTIDGNNLGVNCLYVDTVQGFEFVNGTLNGAGLGGATDGCMFIDNSAGAGGGRGVVLSASRAKNGNPYVVNLSGRSTCTTRSIDIIDNDIQQLNDPGSHASTCISVGNGNVGVKVTGNSFNFVNTITAGVGVDVVQTTNGQDCTAFEAYNNSFDFGAGGTYTACVRLNVTTNKILSPSIRCNTFGNLSNGFNITDAIRLAGNVDNALIENNAFSPGSGGTITNCVNATSSAIRWTNMQGNSYDTLVGTITNQITNGGALNIWRNEGGVFSPGDAAFQTAPTNNATLTTAGQPLVRCAPSGAVTGIILQAGTSRGQYCVVENNSAFTITFAASGTSNVADGVSDVIAANTCRLFVWDANTNLWFRAA